MRQRSVVVEFLGMPGAGKSTLARQAFCVLREKAMPVTINSDVGGKGMARKLRVLSGIAAFAARHPKYALLSGRAISGTAQKSRADLIASWLAWFGMSDYISRRKGQRGIHLVDHGMFQSLWSIGFRAGAADLHGLIISVGSLMPRADLVVVVLTDAASAERRLRERPGEESRLERMLRGSPGVMAESVALLAQVREIVDGFASRWAGMRVLELDNSSRYPLEANADTIADAAQSIYLGQSDAKDSVDRCR